MVPFLGHPVYVTLNDLEWYFTLNSVLFCSVSDFPCKNKFASSANNLTLQESLADAKVIARQQCVYEDPYSEEIYSKFAIDGY